MRKRLEDIIFALNLIKLNFALMVSQTIFSVGAGSVILPAVNWEFVTKLKF